MNVNKAGSGAVTQSKVTGAKTGQVAATTVSGGSAVAKGKPPSIAGRSGPNTRSSIGTSNKKASSRERSVEAISSEYNGAQRSGSNSRRVGASAASSHADKSNSMGPSHKNSLGSKFHSSQRPNQGNTFEFTDQLMEQLGTPEMLIKELKAAKLDIATLKNQLEVKEKSVANYR